MPIRRPTRRDGVPLAVLTLTFLLVTGCAAAPGPAPGAPGEQAGGPGAAGPPAADTVPNCGTEVPVENPGRVVAMFHNGVEAVLALGAGDRLVGAAYLDNPLLPGLAADFTPVSDPAGAAPGQPVYWPEEYPSREEVLRLDVDLVVSGFTGTFTREGLGARAELGNAGIDTYLFTQYCPTVDGGTQAADLAANDVSLESVQRDLTDLGRLLGAQDRAAELNARMRATLDDVAARLDGVTARPRVAMLNAPSGSGERRVFGTGDVATTIITAAGGQQAFPDIAGRQRSVSTEGIITARPDVIVVPACCGADKGPEAAQPLVDELLRDPALAQVPAVRDRKVFTTTFAEVSPGIRNADAVATLARRLHPDRFGG